MKGWLSLFITGIFMIAFVINGFGAFSYFMADTKSSPGTVKAFIPKDGINIDKEVDGCAVTLNLTNKTHVDVNDVHIEAGQKSHPKNNYVEEIKNLSIGAHDSVSTTFFTDHREGVHCNIQWVSFDVTAFDEKFQDQFRVKVHNPPPKEKKEDVEEESKSEKLNEEEKEDETNDEIKEEETDTDEEKEINKEEKNKKEKDKEKKQKNNSEEDNNKDKASKEDNKNKKEVIDEKKDKDTETDTDRDNEKGKKENNESNLQEKKDTADNEVKSSESKREDDEDNNGEDEDDQ
ncbi:hypothetical protein [Alteribacillus bidgolensis]|uniref:hypothetical protein n=1 Tax=Alteribacillus bidgolensis TaxID=930129 RepID=UPI001114629A|nr:hypothetical protein [Alteribacillus bidgolensis]